MQNYYPRARVSDLTVQEMSEETILVDVTNNRVNCLNTTAALVWQNADGTRTVSAIAAELSQSLNTTVDERVVWYALEQLSQKQLLNEPVRVPTLYAQMTRRGFLKKAGLIGAACAIPAIVSMVPPAASAAIS